MFARSSGMEIQLAYSAVSHSPNRLAITRHQSALTETTSRSRREGGRACSRANVSISWMTSRRSAVSVCARSCFTLRIGPVLLPAIAPVRTLRPRGTSGAAAERREPAVEPLWARTAQGREESAGHMSCFWHRSCLCRSGQAELRAAGLCERMRRKHRGWLQVLDCAQLATGDRPSRCLCGTTTVSAAGRGPPPLTTRRRRAAAAGEHRRFLERPRPDRTCCCCR